MNWQRLWFLFVVFVLPWAGQLVRDEAGKRATKWAFDRACAAWLWLIEKLRRWGKGDDMKP